MLAPAHARQILQSAECVCSAVAVNDALRRLARAITLELGDACPLVLTVMGGAVVFSGQLLPLLNFPLECDYVHVTRYGNSTTGGPLEWKAFPEHAVPGRTVLIIDDVLDEGHTLAEIRRRTLQARAARFLAAVLVDKQIGRPKPIAADFVGVTLPDRYLFGFGMDVKGAWRNLPAIYALAQDAGF